MNYSRSAEERRRDRATKKREAEENCIKLGKDDTENIENQKTSARSGAARGDIMSDLTRALALRRKGTHVYLFDF